MNPRDFWRLYFTLELKRVDWPRTILLIVAIVALAAALKAHYMPEVREVQTTVFKRVPEIKVVKDVQRIRIPCPKEGIVTLDRDQVTAQLGPDWAGPATAQRGPDWTGPSTGQPITSALTDDDGSTSPPFQGEGQGGDGLRNAIYVGPDNSRAHETPDPRPPTPDPWPLATADLPETDRGNQVVAVYNSTTGVTDLVAKEKPAPWVQIRNDYVLGLRYGIDHRLNQTGTLYGSWTVLRFKDLYLSGYSELATDPQRIGDDLRWKGQVDLQYRH